jgi:hypothetical protein
LYASNGSINTSDFNEKKDIVDIPRGLSFVNSLHPVAYKWKNSGITETGKIEYLVDGVWQELETPDDTYQKRMQTVPKVGIRDHYGLIAQQVKEAMDADEQGDFAGYIDDTSTGLKGLRYTEFIPLLIKSIQELSAYTQSLESRITQLENSPS